MNALSLFTGAGGLDWGFHQEGIHTIVANDIKQDAAKTFSVNFGLTATKGPQLTVGKYAINPIEATFFHPQTPQVALLIGGPPCQDFSIIRGKESERRGTLSRRGKLYLHYARYLILTRPYAFVFENVQGLISSNKGADLKSMVEDFSHLHLLPAKWAEQKRLDPEETPPLPADLAEVRPQHIPSYRIAFLGVVDMSAHGVPQRRKRLIIIGFREDLPLARDHILFLSEVLHGNPALRRYPLTVLEALEGLPLNELEDEYKAIWREYGENKKRVLEDYVRFHGGSLRDPLLEEALARHREILESMGWYGTSLSYAPEEAFADRSHVRTKESAKVLARMREILPGENHLAVRGTEHQVEGRGFSLVYKRLHPLAPSYTVVAHGGGGTGGYHYRRNLSRLTNRERARLQGFPDGFAFQGRTQEVRAQIGEAVPPLFSRVIAKSLAQVLGDLGVENRAPHGSVPASPDQTPLGVGRGS